MKLSEKILYCRKKAGLSQEALADIIGVSRQAISKWETDEAAPEISKLLLLAREFQVTTDWLLSEDEAEPEKAPAEEAKIYPQEPVQQSGSWLDSVPGVIGKLFRRYGWLCGLYIAGSGFALTMMGILIRVMGQGIPEEAFDMGNTWGANSVWYDNAGNITANPFGTQASASAAANPFVTIGTFVLVLGIVIVIGGVCLAVYLKKRGNESRL